MQHKIHIYYLNIKINANELIFLKKVALSAFKLKNKIIISGVLVFRLELEYKFQKIIEKISILQGNCKTGHSVITTAGRLPAQKVIHTVGLI
jgi:Macro domain